ncbi:MAG: serine/threonine protein kinase [Thermoanaerobaculia bacterium]|nr:serine/threonine protein kinase [Thermoanaerobaculia bacterium]
MDDQPTLDFPAPKRRSDSAASVDGARFAPGTMLDARYRIINRIGRGGMGEVYRAEDLKLGEHVALKFLPSTLSRDASALARLHREVRTARRISHPNVVRVHDIGEAEGETFLSMELVSGEDLSSLISRIGRLPEEKGIALARQICAGLAAAHEKGVLHRDLKPANILIDGKGNARITDFGIAELVSEQEAGVIAGTPAYMAPEQLAGERLTVESEFFSLGLVLYEIFTGERLYQGASVAELVKAHQQPIDLDSSRAASLDSSVQRVLDRCLSRDPAQRPRSAMAVAAALPGGDPLLAALEAGETPSPEMVAEADVEGRLAPKLAYPLLAVGIALLLGVVALRTATSIFVVSGTDLKPAVLDHRASELLDQAGGLSLTEGIGRYWIHEEYRDHTDILVAEVKRPEFWPPLVIYSYRAGETPIAPVRHWKTGVYWHEPPLETIGTAAVEMDHRGKLIRLLKIPSSRDIPSAGASEPDWGDWFEAAGFDSANFREIEPTRLPPTWTDRQRSWEGRRAEDPTTLVRIDAASRGSQVIQWEAHKADSSETVAPPAAALAGLIVLFLMLVLGGAVAWRNLKSGRGDSRGALATAAGSGGLYFLNDLIVEARVLPAGGLSLFFQILALGLVIGAALGAAYLALEPTLRRHLPHTLVSWNRLLRGRTSDPLLARDLFFGSCAGLLVACVLAAATYFRGLVDFEIPHGAAALWGLTNQVINIVHPMAPALAIGLLFLFAIPRVLIPSARIGNIVGGALVLVLAFASGGPVPAFMAAIVIVLARWVGLTGLFGFALAMVNVALVPVAFDLDSWWAPTSLIGPGAILILLLWATRSVTRPSQRSLAS